MRPGRFICHFLLACNALGWTAAAQALIVESGSPPISAPDPAQSKISEGYEALRAQKVDVAEKAFFEANRLNPKSAEALLGLAAVAQVQGKADKAKDWMAAAVSAAPGRPEILQAQARLLSEQGNPAAAVDSYKKAILAFPANAQFRLDLANLYMGKLNKPAEAISLLRDQLKRTPDMAAAHLSLGLALSADGKVDDGLRSLAEATRLESNNPFAFHAQGLLLLKQGRHDRALASFEKALAVRPEFSAAMIGRADTLVAQGKIDAALDAYQRASTLAPNSALPHAMRAQLLERHKRFDEAEAAYRQALKAEPTHAPVMNNLAYLLVTRKTKLDEALALAQRAVAADSSVSGYLDTLGMAQLAKGDAASARKSFEKALAISPGNAKYREHLSLAGAGGEVKPLPAPALAATPVAQPAVAAAAATPVAAAPAKVAPAPVEAKPAAPSAPAAAKPALEDPAKLIGPLLESWRQAWESKDAARYLGFYSKDFVPPAKKSRSAWEADRRAKLDKKGDIQVRIANPFFVLSGNVATVVFDQHYQSSNFSDDGGKRLEWVREGNDWRIRSEGPR